MPKVKLDSQQIKKLLKERVELVAVGVAGFLMVVFLGIGLAGLFGSSSPDGSIVSDNKKLRQAIDSATPPEADSAPKADEKPPDHDGKEPPKDGAKDPPKNGAKDPPKNGTKEEPPKEAAKKPNDYVYPPLDPFAAVNMFPTFNWYDSTAAGDTKRREPKVLPLDFAGKGTSQIDVLLRSFRRYTVEGKKISTLRRPEDKGTQSLPPPMEDLHGERLVLVHAALSFKEQLEQYRKALRFETVEDMLKFGIVPTVARLSVWRRTVRPDGKELSFYPIYDVFPKDDKRLAELRDLGKKDGQPRLQDIKRNDKEVWVIAEPVQKLLQLAVYDETTLQSLGHALAWTGSTPLPRLGYGQYPKVELEGIKPREDTVVSADGDMGTGPAVPGGMPMVPGGIGKAGVPGAGKAIGVQPTGQYASVDLKKYGSLFAERVSGIKINYFSPFGVYLEPPKDTTAKGGAYPTAAQAPATMPYPGMQQKAGFSSYGRMPYPMMPMTPSETSGGRPTDTEGEKMGVANGIPDKLVVRFLDAGVQPGHSYQYYVTVWMENPNFGREKEVAYPKLAEVKEIPSPGAYTPWVTVPDDYRFFVANVPDKNIIKGMKVDGPPAQYDMTQLNARVPVQIHQWTSETRERIPVHDWVIAERLLFARGEEVQRESVQLGVATWNKDIGDFEIGYRLPPEKKGSTRTVFKKTLPIHFGLEEGGPVIVDFAGTLKSEDGNLEVLVLTRDGRLMVRNSRDDDDTAALTGKDRHDRVEAWRTRLREVYMGGLTAPTGDPMGPMGPMGPMRPGR